MAAQGQHAEAPGGRPPNVLFISFDDLNHYVGFLGRHPDAHTPNLDRLAARGMVFERAYCQAPLCNPSRASLMTGMQPATTGVYGNRQPFRFSPVAGDAVTLPQHFRHHGYHTSGSGKVYHGIYTDPVSWDDYAPKRTQQTYPEAQPPQKPHSGVDGLGNLDWGPLDVSDEQMGDYQSVSHCIEQLRRSHDRPFFLTCGFTRPHLPWYAPRRYFEQVDPQRVTLPTVPEDDLDDVPEPGRDMIHHHLHQRLLETGKWSEALTAYLACLRFVDGQIGRLIEALDASEHADNTIIVLWADHGWHLGEKHHWKKFTLWEEATRVPLLIAAPGYKPGRCERPVGLVDLYPTLVELCGLPAREALEGRSLCPLLAEPGGRWEHGTITTYLRGNHAVRFGPWRYIRYADGSEELYDHRFDEMEWTNLAADPAYAKVKRELAAELPAEDAPDAPRLEMPEGEARYEQRIEELLTAAGEREGATR